MHHRQMSASLRSIRSRKFGYRSQSVSVRSVCWGSRYSDTQYIQQCTSKKNNFNAHMNFRPKQRTKTYVHPKTTQKRTSSTDVHSHICEHQQNACIPKTRYSGDVINSYRTIIALGTKTSTRGKTTG